MVICKAISSVEERSKSVTKCNTVLKSIPLLSTYIIKMTQFCSESTSCVLIKDIRGLPYYCILPQLFSKMCHANACIVAYTQITLPNSSFPSLSLMLGGGGIPRSIVCYMILTLVLRGH